MGDFIDFKFLKRPATPNTWLVAPPGFADDARPNAAPPAFACSQDILFSRIREIVAARKRWQLKAEDAAARRISFVASTPLMRFKDDVDIAVLPEPGEGGDSTLAVYSRSRIGVRDLGVNARRVNEILAALSLP